MLQLLWDNKEWLFSGAGVAIAIAVIAVVRRRYCGPQEPAATRTASGDPLRLTAQASEVISAPVTESAPTRVTQVSRLTFAEVNKTLEDAPPLQKAAVAKRFVGIRVLWETRLWSAEEEREGCVRLCLDFGEMTSGLVLCHVDLERYKELAILKKGAQITVSGEISKVLEGSVQLDNAELFISGK